jgi:hypothetical protein
MRLIAQITQPHRTVASAPNALSDGFIAFTALLLLLLAQWILCHVILGTNYYGIDGKMAQSVVLTAFKFGGYFDVTNLNPIQGVSSQLLPKNAWANPAFWPFALLNKEDATDVSALIALACFASAVYVMMRCFDAPVLVSALAGQACIVLFAPALLLVHTPFNFCFTPGDAIVYAPYMLALGLLARLQPGSLRSFALTAGGISALVLYSIYCDPIWTMIAAIGWAVPFAVVTFSALHPRTIMVRCAALACCFGVLLLSGAATYLYALSQYTARVQYADTVDRVRGPQYVSAMTYSTNMKYFYLACALGGLMGLVTLRNRVRVLVVAALTAFAVWVLYSLIYLLLKVAWIPPVPIYLEQCLFALYLAAAVVGYWGFLNAAAAPAARAAAPLIRGGYAILRRPAPTSLSDQAVSEGYPLRRWPRVSVALTVICVAILPAKVVNYALNDARAYATTFYVPWANEPELTNFFSENVGLKLGQPFRGAINFLDTDMDTMVTLWSHAIATINEYSQLVTPEPFYFVYALLKKDMRGVRNHFGMYWSDVSYSPSYWKTLQVFGTRYSSQRRPLAPSYDPGLPLTTKPHRPVWPDESPGTWYLYELPHPNVGDYSPTEAVTAHTGPEIMAILAQPDFDFAKQVVISAPLDTPLAPARDMRLSIIRGGLHVSGMSGGTSLVVLPQQFSHCLRARDSRVRFVRANLMFAGMIFAGDIDTDILFDYGIFSPGCRLADLADMKRLDLKIDQRMPHLEGDRILPDWGHAVATLRSAAAAVR